jgi:aminoglycoside phosphotransferase (APT) family kinase protein
MTEQLENLIAAARSAFPDRGDFHVDTANPMAGNRHPMTAFFADWADGTSLPLVLRRYPAPPPLHMPGDTGPAQHEFNTLRWLSEIDFPVPTAYAHGRDDGGEWLLTGALSGQSWWLPIGLVDFDRTLPPIVRAQVRLMARLHSLDPAEHANAAHFTSIERAAVIDQAADLARSAEDLDAVTALERIAEHLAADDVLPDRILAVDATVANMLIGSSGPHAGEVIAWLDWDEAALGDPRWDVAALISALRGSYGMDALAARAAADYTRDTMRQLPNLEVWVALRAVLDWIESAWLQKKQKVRELPDFPAALQIAAAYDSRRAWGLAALHEVEADEDQ